MRFGRRPADRGVSPPACRGVRSRPADRGVFGRTRDRGVPPSDEPWGFQASVPLPRGDSGGVTRPGGEVAGVVPCPRARGGRLARAPRRVTGGHLARSPGPTPWAPPVPPRRPSGGSDEAMSADVAWANGRVRGVTCPGGEVVGSRGRPGGSSGVILHDRPGRPRGLPRARGRPSGVGRGHVGGRRMGERASPGRHVQIGGGRLTGDPKSGVT